jgi:hypothetical protein
LTGVVYFRLWMTLRPVGIIGRGLPSWLIVKLIPAIVRVPVRDAGVPLAVTVTLTVPDPAPLAGVTVTQLNSLVVVHEQPLGLDTLIVLLVPAKPTRSDVVESA